MAHGIVSRVETLGIDTVQLSHSRGEIGLRGFDEQVVVIGHEAIGIANPLVFLHGRFQNPQEGPAISVIMVDRPFPVPSGGNMVQSAGKF